MTQDNSTDQTITGDQGSGSSDGAAAVGSLTLAELNAHLGKDFKDTPTALKALQDTFSFVGKRKEDIASEVRAELAAKADGSASDSSGGSSQGATKSDIQRLETELFYSQNPQYKEYASLISKMGGSPAEVVQMPEFTSVYEKAKVADGVASTRSVVSSNGRLNQTKTVVQEAIAVANTRATNDDVATVLARGINEEIGQ